MRIIKTFVDKNKANIILLAIALVVGLAAGLLFTSLMPIDQKASLYEYIRNACFDNIESSFVNFLRSLLLSFRFWALIFIAGISIKFRFSAGLAMFIKGYFIGYALGTTTINFGFNGFVFSFASVLPQLLIIIPTMFLFSCQALNNTYGKKKTNIFGQDWMLISAVFGVIFVIYSFIDGYIIPVFLNAIGQLFL